MSEQWKESTPDEIVESIRRGMRGLNRPKENDLGIRDSCVINKNRTCPLLFAFPPSCRQYCGVS